ncbi:MAG: HAD family hydrolase [Marinoscillum sp.]
MTEKGGLALFDFDDTITVGDSLRAFIVFARGWPEFSLGAIALSPIVALQKLNLISTKKAKEMVLGFFFKDMSIETFEELCERFSKEAIPQMVNKLAAEKIANHLQNNDRVVVVSASPGHWVRPWALQNGLECVSTELEVVDHKITGKILGENCKGDEKVRRIQEYLSIEKHNPIYAYGDSKHDLSMLMLADYSFYKPFRKKERREKTKVTA